MEKDWRLTLTLLLIYTDYEQTPQRPEQSDPELALEVLPDEDDDAEVGVEPVTDEEGREHEEPGGGGGEEVALK